MRSFLVLLVAGLSLAGIAAGQAGTIRETTTYFAVKGRTLQELDADLSRRGPAIGEGGARHPGATEVRFKGKVDYKVSAAGCAVSSPNIELDLEVMLPRWNPPRRVDPETLLIWQTLEADIRRHEGEHAAIAKLWLRKLESALLNLRPERDCKAMEARVGVVTRRFFARHEAAQIEFDRVEGETIERRLRKALDVAVTAYQANEAARTSSQGRAAPSKAP